MDIRKAEVNDGRRMLEMLLALDKETKYMLLEEGERSTEIGNTQRAIADIISDGGVQFIAEEKDEFIGFLTAKRGLSRKVKHTAYIVVGLRDGYRGKGIGTSLISKLDKWSKENDITRLELTVICENEDAKRFYENNGFQVEGIKRNSIFMDGKYYDEYYMSKI